MCLIPRLINRQISRPIMALANPMRVSRDAVMGASEDGSYIYFVATGVLADGAVKGADNLYVLHESEGVWTTKYIATLSDEDAKSWRGHSNEFPAGPEAKEKP